MTVVEFLENLCMSKINSAHIKQGREMQRSFIQTSVDRVFESVIDRDPLLLLDRSMSEDRMLSGRNQKNL